MLAIYGENPQLVGANLGILEMEWMQRGNRAGQSPMFRCAESYLAD